MAKNIDLFNQYTAQIFAVLYDQFPVAKTLNICEISECHILDDFGRVLNNAGEISQEFLVCKATIIWLSQSGYIHSKNGNEYSFCDCVLTAKGLEILKAIPEKLKTTKTVGEALIDTIKTGSVQLSIELARTAISTGVKLGLAE